MKKIVITSLIALAVSCQSDKKQSLDELIENGDLNALRKKQASLQAQSDSLHNLSQKLTERISVLDPKAESLVKFKIAKDTVYHHYIKLQANVETDEDVQVSPEFGGVLRLLVGEGQYVRRGQLIATISDGGLRDQLSQSRIAVDQARAAMTQAEIQRDLAKTTFYKQQTLWKQKIGSEIQYLQAKTHYQTAQKQVSAARNQVSAAQKGVGAVESQLAKTRVVAPFNGRVEQLIMQSGQAAMPGVPILRLVNPATVKAIANVPETYLSKIKIGTRAIVDLPSLKRKFDSRVNLVSTAINSMNRTFKVEVPIRDKDGLVKPNLNAQILLNDYSSHDVFVLKKNVLKKDSNGSYVFVAKNVKNHKGEVKKQYVDVGYSDDGLVEITAGIKSGDYIITEAAERLLEGDKVQLSN